MARLRDEPDDETPATARRRTRIKHRIPVRIRHYWKLLAVVCAGLVVLLLVFGQARVRPYFAAEPEPPTTVTENIAGTGDLFDGGDHDIRVDFNQAEYADMMRTFREEGEKEFIRADITIDGTAVPDVGLRLKGNSTLFSLRGDEMMPGGGESSGDGGQDAGGGPPGGPGGGGGPGMVQLSEDAPEELPWLISFEEYSSGRAYQGHSEIALRPAAAGSDTALNEALALEMTAADGQTTQDHALTSFGVNGGEAVPRMLLDAPDAAWAEQRGGGVLYKARADGSLDYLGDDPTDYEEAFDQINGEGTYDLQPVMNLLRFIAESDDEQFARELDEHVDVRAFARYLAMQDLMSNGDAMDGPGNNYYLWYDTEQERFTVLSWDLNLSFGAMDDMMPSGGMPGGPPGGGDGPGDGPGGPGGMRGSSALKDRFLADDGFRELYEQAYADMYRDLVVDGTAADLVDQVRAAAQRAGDTTADAEGADLAEQIASISEQPDPDSVGPPGMPGQ